MGLTREWITKTLKAGQKTIDSNYGREGGRGNSYSLLTVGHLIFYKVDARAEEPDLNWEQGQSLRRSLPVSLLHRLFLCGLADVPHVVQREK